MIVTAEVEREVRRTMFDYVAAIDARDYPLLRSVLADRLDVSMGPGGEVGFVGMGPDAVVMSAEQFVERNRTLFLGFAGTHHQVTNVRVDPTADGVRVRAYLQATHFLSGEPETEYSFGASYDNDLVDGDGGWRISAIRIAVQWERGDVVMIEQARALGVERLSRSEDAGIAR